VNNELNPINFTAVAWSIASLSGVLHSSWHCLWIAHCQSYSVLRTFRNY